MYGLEIIGSLFACVLLSGLALLLAKKSFTPNDDIVSKEDAKPKTKTSKKSQKVKVAQKETEKIKQEKKVEEEDIEVIVTKKNVKKEKKEKKAQNEVIDTVVSNQSEKITPESSADWKKVNKPIKKVNKKDNKVEDEINESNVNQLEAAPTKIINAVKSTMSGKQDAIKTASSKLSSKVESAVESRKQPEIEINEMKEKVIVNAINVQIANEEMDLRRRIGELMSELDKQKSVNKEENKISSQTINQLNKDLENAKQKVKISQSGEEKLMEDLKKRNAAFNDFKQQYMIVQSELTKNIVQCQSLTREKEKIENRMKTLEENNRQFSEVKKDFDEINSEKENLEQKLSIIEEEYKVAKVQFNESYQAKESELNGRINQLQQEKQQMQEQLVNVQTDLIENNSKLQAIQEELLDTKTNYSDLLTENACLEKKCADVESASTLVKQHQALENSMREQANEEKMKQVLNDFEELKRVYEELVKERETSVEQNNELSEKVLNEKIAALTEELAYTKVLLTEATKEASNHKENCTLLAIEIEHLQKQKSDLSMAVEQYKAGVIDTEAAILKLQVSFCEEEQKYQENLLQLERDSLKKEASLMEEVESTKSLLSIAQNDSETQKRTCESLLSEIADLKNEKDDLVFLVTKYKSGLENTESILSNLQISVNEEEAKWRENLQKSEKEAEESKSELERVYKDLMRIRNLRTDKNELNFAYHCVDKSLSSLIDEMETRMNHFDASLEAVIQERDNALAQVNVQMNGHSSEYTGHNGTTEDEVARIKEDLANQIERNQLLETRCTKYKALVDIGKDALDAEKIQIETLRGEVQQLQTRLSAALPEAI